MRSRHLQRCRQRTHEMLIDAENMNERLTPWHGEDIEEEDVSDRYPPCRACLAVM